MIKLEKFSSIKIFLTFLSTYEIIWNNMYEIILSTKVFKFLLFVDEY